MELKKGKLLQNGKYRIEGVLGQGGFGITYLAVQVGLNRKVAVKEFYMKEHCNRDADTSFVSVPSVGSRELVEGFKNKFVKEAQNIASFNHNNIIRIHDIFEENGTAYYVMEYHDCGSLSDYVTRKGRLSEEEAMFFIRQIADALAYIHELKINHLDIKPGNILLDKKNNAILIDFGLSKHYDEVGGQTTSSPVGRSKGYAPMEQYKQGGVSQFSPSTDIYSLGATMYKLVTGETPAEADEINEDGLSFPADVVLSDSVRKAIEFAMQPKRKDRPQSIEEFLRSFEVAACSKGQSDEATVIDVVDNNSVDEETVFETKEQEQERKAEEEIKRRVEAELKRMAEEKKRKDEQEQERKRKEAEEEYQLGEEYYKKGDYPEAVKWYRKSAEQGNAAAQYNLGFCYKKGQGVTQDYSEAVKWYRKSAEQGNTDAQNDLGFCYDQGQGVTQDYSEAVKWYRKSAEQGNASAQNNLGFCYQHGQGVTRDYSEAVKWYRKSAEQGNTYAQNNLGFCYQHGQGVTQDYSEAVKWYRKSAEQGHASAQNNLGFCYDEGQGVTQDYSEAVKWYRKSAEQGNASAQYNLALCYEKGQGVTQDIAEAMKWYKKAADNGHQDAKDKVEEMTKQLSAKQINGHDYVDLGLPSGLKWATCNVGANKPEDYGDYFAWGETETKSKYTEDNSLTRGHSVSELRRRGIVDGNNRLTSSYDAARAKWGRSWRMPTKEELEELVRKCTWTWTTQNGVKGYKVTGPNGKSIFLPAAGCRNGSSLYDTGRYGNYLCSSPDGGIDDYAYCLRFSSDSHFMYHNYRMIGRSVRPITE